MNLKIIILLAVLLCVPLSSAAQQMESDNDRQMRMQRNNDEYISRRQWNRAGYRDLYATRRNATMVREKNGVYLKYKPGLTKQDLAAIEVNPADLRTYSDFLKQPKTGIVRLQNAKICSPQDLVVQASGTCPNNISSKATAFSFRKDDYATLGLSDMSFNDLKFQASGIFNFGIMTTLGDVDLKTVTASTNGVKQLLEMQPSNDEQQIREHFQLLTQGIRVGDFIYKRDADVKENTSYVLRAIAYKGKVFRSNGAQKTNVLEDDLRVDVIMIFRVVRKHDDGSVTIAWKELNRINPPDIVLKETKSKEPKSSEAKKSK